MKSSKPMGKKAHAMIIAGTITGGLLLGGVGGFLIGHFAKPPKVDMGNLDAGDFEDRNDGLLAKYEKCKAAGKNPVEEFGIADLANISIQKLLARDHYIAYGFGQVYSALNLDIANVNIKNGDEAMEESVSMGSGIITVKVAQRDYMHKDNVESHLGNIGDNLDTITWNEDSAPYDHDSFAKRFGKLPNSCFNYIVSSKTVLDTSVVSAVEGGYSIHLQLDTVGSVVRYIRRMMNLSGSEVSQFYDVQLVLNVDSDFNLITSSINETYSASMANVPAKCNGQITTYYDVDSEVSIPSVGEKYDYTAIAKGLGI